MAYSASVVLALAAAAASTGAVVASFVRQTRLVALRLPVRRR
jgi:hypothetical protein